MEQKSDSSTRMVMVISNKPGEPVSKGRRRRARNPHEKGPYAMFPVDFFSPRDLNAVKDFNVQEQIFVSDKATCKETLDFCDAAAKAVKVLIDKILLLLGDPEGGKMTVVDAATRGARAVVFDLMIRILFSDVVQALFMMQLGALYALDDWVPLVASDEAVALQAGACRAVVQMYEQDAKRKTDREERQVFEAEVSSKKHMARFVQDRLMCSRRATAWEALHKIGRRAATAALADVPREEGAGPEKVVKFSKAAAFARNSVARLHEALKDMKPTEEEEKRHCEAYRLLTNRYARGDDKVPFADARLLVDIERCRTITKLCQLAMAQVCSLWKRHGDSILSGPLSRM